MPPAHSWASWRTRWKARLAFVAIVLTLGLLHLPAAQAQTAPVDRITNNGFEDPAAPLGFDAFSPSDGSVVRTTVNPISGSGS